jgi:hypothetical protein
MNTRVRDHLIEVSRKKGIIGYQELCKACGLELDMRNSPHDRGEIGRILGEISTYEYRQKRPLLSAVVLSKSGEEGDGFFKLCEDLGITGDWRRLKKDDVFVVTEINKCLEFCSNIDNYKAFKDV